MLHAALLSRKRCDARRTTDGVGAVPGGRGHWYRRTAGPVLVPRPGSDQLLGDGGVALPQGLLQGRDLRAVAAARVGAGFQEQAHRLGAVRPYRRHERRMPGGVALVERSTAGDRPAHGIEITAGGGGRECSGRRCGRGRERWRWRRGTLGA